MANPQHLSEGEQKRIGQSIPSAMTAEHVAFVKRLVELIDRGEIDLHRPESLLDTAAYASLDAERKADVDRNLVNIASLAEHIESFYRSKATPDASPELENMIDQLWQMLRRIETEPTIFKF